MVDYLQCQGELQQLLVAGSPVAEQLGVVRIPLDGFSVLLHRTGKITCVCVKNREILQASEALGVKLHTATNLSMSHIILLHNSKSG